jgi:hypothetical protein
MTWAKNMYLQCRSEKKQRGGAKGIRADTRVGMSSRTGTSITPKMTLAGDTSSSGATVLRALTGKETGRGTYGEKGAIIQRSEQGTKRGGAAPEVRPRSIKYHLHVGACTCTTTTTFDYADKPASASRQLTKQGVEKGEPQRTRYGRAHAPHILGEGRGETGECRGEKGEERGER